MLCPTVLLLRRSLQAQKAPRGVRGKRGISGRVGNIGGASEPSPRFHPTKSELKVRITGDTRIDVGSVTAVGPAAIVGLEEVGVAVVQTVITVDAVADTGLNTDKVCGTDMLRRQTGLPSSRPL